MGELKLFWLSPKLLVVGSFPSAALAQPSQDEARDHPGDASYLVTLLPFVAAASYGGHNTGSGESLV